MAIFRVFVEKKSEFAVEAKKLEMNLQNVLGIKKINRTRIFNRYDVTGIDSSVFNAALNGIFCEPQVDDYFFELPKINGFIFACEFLPGQYDCRADFCQQCIKLVDFGVDVKVKTAKIYCFEGNFSLVEQDKIKAYLLNPVECRQTDFNSKIEFDNEIETSYEIEILTEFNSLDEKGLQNFLSYYNLAMDLDDLKFCQNYFKNEEKRSPTMAEIKVLDTYWSDHCRHTTFLTNLEEIEILDSNVKKVFEEYLNIKDKIEGSQKPINLMDLATLAAKKLKYDGKLTELEESDEINACSVEVDVKFKNKSEKWFLVFKNETHNHPTEIEPFGGAATCLGGAIRDPLSARAYVFQAMRISGAANPLEPFENTLKGKLPQRKIVVTAAEGYSSYGNQVGVATGFVQEIYHPSYLAKRMEIGAVIGAVLKENVVKKKPQAEDVIVLIGGKTGRDGCGGAVGSSKNQTESSVEKSGAEVQKGNPVEERKIQRFFRNKKVSRLIKRCNDFGAGGVCVAIGELADGLQVDLNAIPKKYDGLNDVELAISESQERMAVVVSKSSLATFLKEATAENLLATPVAKVTNSGRLQLRYFDKNSVDLSRDFLNSNGVQKYASVKTNIQQFNLEFEFENSEQGWINQFCSLNICSQKGLVDMFDSTIGAGCVLMPYGGKYQSTKAQAMAFTFPTDSEHQSTREQAMEFTTSTDSEHQSTKAQAMEFTASTDSEHQSTKAQTMEFTASTDSEYQSTREQAMAFTASTNECETISIAAFGFNPFLMEQSPFYGAQYAVIESVAKIVACGGDINKCWLTLQEYFPSLDSPAAWGQPFLAMLGAFNAQIKLNVAAIGGKDSMSGTFENLKVVSTLVSFAVSVGNIDNVVSPEFKKSGSRVAMLIPDYGENFEPKYENILEIFGYIQNLIKNKEAVSIYALGFGGISQAIGEMCFGNRLGFKFADDFDYDKLGVAFYGGFIVELNDNFDLNKLNNISNFKIIGQTIENFCVIQKSLTIDLNELEYKSKQKLESVFPTKPISTSSEKDILTVSSSNNESKKYASIKISVVKVLVPIFPGTNCEFDLISKFEKAGAVCVPFIINNLSAEDSIKSVKQFVHLLKNSNILALPGGFSAGDEPDGSAKFIAAFFRNGLISNEIDKFLNLHDGLIIGICNGFQALVKLGLIEHGKIVNPNENLSTLTYNEIGRHQSKLVRVRVACNQSPWLQNEDVENIYTVPISNGEGRFVAPTEVITKFIKNNQVALQYVDFEGKASMNVEYNPSGSYLAIEGLTSPDGRVLGKMGHSERVKRGLFANVPDVKEQYIFQAGVDYFTKLH